MIINHTNKFIFFRNNGKNGTTSIENALLKYHEGPSQFVESKDNKDLMHYPPRYFFLNENNKPLLNYYKFSVVRNPYDWYLSIHRWCIRDNNKSVITDNGYYEPSEFTPDSPRGSFNAKRVIETFQVINQIDYMWDNQYCGLCFRGRPAVNTVLRFEHLQKDFNDLMDSLNLPREILEHKRKKRDYDKWKPYDYYYSKDGMEMVEQICDFDFKVFGYEKESNK